MSVQMPLTEQPRRLLSDASYAKIDRELTKYPSDQKRGLNVTNVTAPTSRSGAASPMATPSRRPPA